MLMDVVVVGQQRQWWNSRRALPLNLVKLVK
jgi:hypothetical protein